eukprot:Nk52_evm74s223 gene=Nk52_evmTU74s223
MSLRGGRKKPLHQNKQRPEILQTLKLSANLFNIVEFLLGKHDVDLFANHRNFQNAFQEYYHSWDEGRAPDAKGRGDVFEVHWEVLNTQG